MRLICPACGSDSLAWRRPGESSHPESVFDWNENRTPRTIMPAEDRSAGQPIERAPASEFDLAPAEAFEDNRPCICRGCKRHWVPGHLLAYPETEELEESDDPAYHCINCGYDVFGRRRPIGEDDVRPNPDLVLEWSDDGTPARVLRLQDRDRTVLTGEDALPYSFEDEVFSDEYVCMACGCAHSADRRGQL